MLIAPLDSEAAPAPEHLNDTPASEAAGVFDQERILQGPHLTEELPDPPVRIVGLFGGRLIGAVAFRFRLLLGHGGRLSSSIVTKNDKLCKV